MPSLKKEYREKYGIGTAMFRQIHISLITQGTLFLWRLKSFGKVSNYEKKYFICRFIYDQFNYTLILSNTHIKVQNVSIQISKYFVKLLIKNLNLTIEISEIFVSIHLYRMMMFSYIKKH